MSLRRLSDIKIEPPRSLYIHDKPEACLACPYHEVGGGFCPDWSPPEARIAFLLEAAGDNEIIDREPLVGAAGHVFNKHFLFQLGYTRSDVLLANTLRCHPPENKYPTGPLRKQAERACRVWDGAAGRSFQDRSLNDFKPDTFLITLHPSDVNRSWNLLRPVQKDVEKAFRLIEQGRRVVVLMGDKPMTLVKPDLIGGVTKWRGHWGPLDWGHEMIARFQKSESGLVQLASNPVKGANVSEVPKAEGPV